MLVPGISEICHTSVRNLSENCQLQKTVIIVSENCQITIRNLSFTKLCQNSVRKNTKFLRKCVRTSNYVRKLSVTDSEMCQNSVRKSLTDIFLTYFCTGDETLSGNIWCKKPSKHSQNWFSDSFLTIFSLQCFLDMFQKICRNLSKICRFRYLRQFSDRFLYEELTVFWHIFYVRYISGTFPNWFWHI